MLAAIGASSIEALVDEAVPARIRLDKALNLPDGMPEHEFLRELRSIAARNELYKSYIGLGYYDCVTPSVILRNVLENPGWYTPYTPYQAEIAQGRLEALLNFQTMVRDLTAMEVATASLLDEATAAAEAMTMLHRVQGRRIEHVVGAAQFFVADSCFPQTIEVLRARAEPLGIELVVGDPRRMGSTDRMFGALLQTPDEAGLVHDLRDVIADARRAGIAVAVATDLLSLTLLTPPGELGADVVLGSSQRFGVPMGYGGPHAAFFATLEKHVRQAPGRIIGVSVDAHGNRAYRMSLQTREQHIRREKATSNICTAQALLANIASFYAVYHGPSGLTAIGRRVHAYARLLERELGKLGLRQLNALFFDTLRIEGADPRARARGGAGGPDEFPVSRRPGRERRDRRDDQPRRPRGDRRRLCRCGRQTCGGRPLRVAARHRSAGRRGSHVGVSDASGFQHASLRNRDDALHPRPRAQGHRPRHVDDSAGLVHDEAERRVGDAADYVARVLEAPSVRASRADGRLSADLQRARGAPSPRSRASRRCRCSPTRARRASLPG